MRKMIFGAAAMAMLALASCSNNGAEGGKCGSAAGCGDCKKGDKIYTGLLPAADVAGIRYTLKLDYDDDNNYTDGEYDLVEIYIASDSTSATGYQDAARFKSEGNFTVINGTGDNSAKKYIKLVEDRKGKSQGGSSDTPMYFLVASDSTLVMVNSDLEESTTPGLNYTLQLVK